MIIYFKMIMLEKWSELRVGSEVALCSLLFFPSEACWKGVRKWSSSYIMGHGSPAEVLR